MGWAQRVLLPASSPTASISVPTINSAGPPLRRRLLLETHLIASQKGHSFLSLCNSCEVPRRHGNPGPQPHFPAWG